MTKKFYNIIRQLLCLVLLVPFMQVYGQKKVTDYLELDTILAYPDLTYHTEYVYTQYEDIQKEIMTYELLGNLSETETMMYIQKEHSDYIYKKYNTKISI